MKIIFLSGFICYNFAVMEVAIKNIKLSKLRHNKGQIEGLPQNPRLVKDRPYKKLLQSLTEDPEMLSLKELWIFPFNGYYVVIAGNQRLSALKELGVKEAPCKILPADTPVQKLCAFAIKDNVSSGEFDFNILANEWDERNLIDWNVPIPDTDTDIDIIEKKEEKITKDEEEEQADADDKNSFYKSMVEDVLYESDNEFEIPLLRLDMQAGKLILPFAPWGADSRLRKDIATYHFYVDDYRFEALFKDPVKVILSGVKQVVEPNLSLYDTTPIAYGLHLIYKKRWLARYFQDCGIKVYVDLNVARKFYDYNCLGVPKGYNAFFTRGYNDRLNYLEEEYAVAQRISQKKKPDLIVYGGGKKIKEFCMANGILYTEQFMEDR